MLIKQSVVRRLNRWLELAREGRTNEECWNWTGAKSPEGYGRFSGEGVGGTAHRAIFQVFVREVAKDDHVHHKCNNPSCVNPSHLEIATPRENALAECSHTTAKRNSEKTHCIRGHEFTPENTKTTYRNGIVQRRCRQCNIEDKRRRHESIKQASGIVGNTEKTHCPQGHPYSGENLYLKTDKSGKTERVCRECERTRKRLYMRRKAQEKRETKGNHHENTS